MRGHGEVSLPIRILKTNQQIIFNMRKIFYTSFLSRRTLRGESDCAAQFPLLKSLVARVRKEPNIKQWMDNPKSN